MKNIRQLFTWFFLYGLAMNVQGQSLEEFLKMASENNPGLKAKYLEFEAALTKVAQVNSLPDPVLSFGYFISSVETRVGPQQAKFGLAQMFPWFGTLSSRENAAKLMAEVKFQEFIQARNQLYFDVKSAWYPIYELKRKIDLHTEYKEILTSMKEIATSRYENSGGSLSDVLRVDIMISNSETEIDIMNEMLKPMEVRLNTLLNREVDASVNVPETLTITLIEDHYRRDSLLVMNPMIQALKIKSEAIQMQETVARKQGLPKIGVGLDYVVVGKRTDMDVPDNGKDIIMPMISVSLPIYRGKYDAAVKETQLMKDVVAYSIQEEQNRLQYVYEMAWFDIRRALEQITLYSEQSERTSKLVDLLMVSYSNSGKEFEEVLRMQQELLKYDIKAETAVREYFIAVAKLDLLTAKTESL